MESSICRVCLENTGNMVNIFEATQKSGISIAQMISQWSGHPVEREDPFPKTICILCLQDAKNAYEMEPTDERGHQLKDSLEEAYEDGRIAHQYVVQPIKEEVPNTPDSEEPKKDLLEDDSFWEKYCCISDSEFDSPQVIEDHSKKKNGHGTNNRNAKMTDNCSLKCNYCSLTFDKKSRLQVHMENHVDNRPHQCYLCLKAFKTSEILKVHMRTHTGERPFQCSHCPKSFTTNSNLKRHLRSVTKCFQE
ncbi:zinc finger protein 700 [Drosophila rhopaloa]|uniref:Zinc finger protein 700 n=1 Tax=Drosophila rhopaloa TaxID=1041015 RepID=A0A6P4EY36_DRORH|nr:zinc finger protein 700 [Drosophila rhopaloa]